MNTGDNQARSSTPEIGDILVVIPVYNHGATLHTVAKAVLAIHPHVMVVDDGSTDGGPDTLKGLPLRLMRLPRNQGKGAAVLAAAAQARGFTHIITIDADGQHDPADIPAFVAAIRRLPHAVVVGARNFNTPNVPVASAFGRRFSQFWMFVQTGCNVSDVQSGFRAYPLAVLRELHLWESRYSFEVEVLVKAAWAGFAIEEIPVRVYYPPAAERVSHFLAVRDNARMTLLNTRLTIRAMVPVPFRRAALRGEGGISLLHPLKSLRLLLEERTSPGELGRSAALSLLVSTLPLPGLQSMLLLFCIGWLRLNRLCALVLVPLTWPPVVPGLGVLLGYRLRHGYWLTEFSVQTLGYEAGQRFLEWMLGSVLLAPILGLLAGLVVWCCATLTLRSVSRQEKRA